MKVDLAEVQGLVIKSYRRITSRHLIFRFGDASGGRAFLRELAHRAMMADADPNTAADPLLNVGVTYNGLGALEVDPALLAKFDAVFKLGPGAVKMALGDVPGSRSDPAGWWEGQFATEDVHCVVHLYARSDDAAADGMHAVREVADANALTELVPRRDGTTLQGRWFAAPKMHFGYTDGISEPAVCWHDDAPRSPAQLDFRHFVLGYSTDQCPSAPACGPAADFARDSIYGLFRWVYQDVAAFNRFLATEGPQLFPELSDADAAELLAAKMMGRWRDGTPLVLSPERPDPQLARSNDFGYATGDPDGLRCPFSAHIRIVNPRDTPLDPIVVDGVPRILRRGMPYGTPLEGTTDDGADRGLVGMFLCADLRKVVYSLAGWVMRNDFSPVYHANRRVQDPLFGNRSMPGTSAEFTIPGVGGAATVKSLPDFVHTKGTAFLLYPGKTALTTLSQPLSGSQSL
jgi:deferrochelatase/peroxidase EfeB